MKYKANRYTKSSECRSNKRIIQEYGIEEANRVGALDSLIKQQENKKELKKKRKKQKKQNKTKNGLHIGIEYSIKYSEFIQTGGDPKSCPFA
jgi:hypothetical protein